MMTSKPVLTICIPSYNRGERVRSLVIFLRENILPKYGHEIEILVVNNCSTDETGSLLAPYEGGNLRLINRTEFLPTAEENMVHSVQYCHGEYIWFLGDDDLPITDTLSAIMPAIRNGDADMFVFNSMVIDADGGLLSNRLMKLKKNWVDLQGRDVVLAAGFVFGLAGISNVIFRRAHADVAEACRIIDIERIYSHVAWLLFCFADKRARLVNYPLVYYRNTPAADQFRHFVKEAKRRELGDYYFWSFGLLKLLRYLVTQKVLEPETVASISEVRRDGTRYRLLDEIIHKLYEQLSLGAASDDSRNKVSKADFEDYKTFLYSVDLFTYDSLARLEAILEVGASDKGGVSRRLELKRCKNEFLRVFNKHAELGFRRARCKGLYHGFEVFRFATGWLGIIEGAPGLVKDEILSWVDPVDIPPDAFVADSRAALEARISDYMARVTRENMENIMPQKWRGLDANVRGIREALGHFVQLAQTRSAVEQQKAELVRQATFPVRLVWKLVFSPLRSFWARMGLYVNRGKVE